MGRRRMFALLLGGMASSGWPREAACGEPAAWGTAAGGLRFGLQLESSAATGHLVVYLRNVSGKPQDLLVALGDLQRFDLVAIAADGDEHIIEQRAAYRPCGGLCSVPVAVRLEAGAAWSWEFALVDLLSVPREGPYTDLQKMLVRGDAVRASFEMTKQQLATNNVRLKDPWIGRIVSNEVRAT